MLRFAVCLATCVLLLWGCGGDASSPTGDANRPAPTVAEVDLAIGVAEGEAPYMLGRISSVVADEQGRIFVADRQGNQVRAYDPSGVHLFDVATAGEGPAEVNTPCCLAFGPEGDLWVRDDQNRRYIRFQVDAEGATPAGQIRMDHTAFGYIVPTTFDADGHLIDVGSVSNEDGNQTVRMHRSASNETILQQPIPDAPEGRLSVQEIDMDGGGTAFLQQPFGPRAVDAHAPNSDWAFAITDRYEVVRYTASGDTLHVIARDVLGPSLSDEEREQARSSLERYASLADLSVEALQFGVPDRKPPITRIFFDADSRLWVQRSTPDGTPNEADVYTRNGQLNQVVQWPEDVTLHMGYLTADVLYGMRTTKDGVPQVVRLRM